MRALVIGGTGFIGSHIVKYLLSESIEVSVLIRRESNISHLADKRIEFKYGNISDVNSLFEHTKDIDLVYSVFGILGRWGIPDQKYWEINTDGVKNLLDSCLNQNIKQFLHISSAGVLGPFSNGIVADESFPYNPSNIYEKTKCEAEKEILDYGKKHGIPFTIIRPEFVYGPGDMHVLGLFKSIEAKRFVFLGNGSSLLHPTYIDDLIQGIHLCTYNQNTLGKIFLITGDRPVTVKELAKTIAEELNVSLPKIKIPLFFANATANILEFGAKIANFEPLLTKSRVKFFTENRAFSYEKARNKLGYVPKVEFREGVKRTIRWYRENRYL